MSSPRRIAFFAPIKPPDHPIPSGDRLIAQNLVKALKVGGHKVDLASRYICYSKRHAPEILAERKSGALKEAQNLVDAYLAQDKENRPELWITYHPYCKAPDWIGPVVSAALDIPYITLEAARTGQGGDEDPWQLWRAEAQQGIRQANMHLVFKPSDRTYLTELLGTDEKLRDLPTFVDLESLSGDDVHVRPISWDELTPVLITTGMMRKGKKDKNFYMLAEILSGLVEVDWKLIVVGGGPEEKPIRTAFNRIPDERMHWTGQVEHKDVLKWMRASDVFIWPGWKEPIGMVYLEAEAQGIPVLAYESMGVPLVVSQGETGLLAKEGDVEAMRSNIVTLLSDENLRDKMGEAAREKVAKSHSLQAASHRLNEVLSEFFN